MTLLLVLWAMRMHLKVPLYLFLNTNLNLLCVTMKLNMNTNLLCVTVKLGFPSQRFTWALGNWKRKANEEERWRKRVDCRHDVGTRVLGISPENLRTRHSSAQHLLRQRARACDSPGTSWLSRCTTQIEQACTGMKINFRYISRLTLHLQIFPFNESFQDTGQENLLP